MARPASVRALAAMLAFLSASALLGGGLMLTDPSGASLEMPLELLDGTPFGDYRIPGLILLTVFGAGSLLAAYGVMARPRWAGLQWLVGPTGYHWAWACALGVGTAQIVWILVQVTLIGPASWLQPFYAGLGAAIVAASLLPPTRHHLARGESGAVAAGPGSGDRSTAPGVGGSSRFLAAGALYFGLVFAVGFVLGTVRVLLVVPLVGERIAELGEMPLMLLAAYVAAGWVVRRMGIPAGLRSRLPVGLIGLALLLGAELLVALLVRGVPVDEFIAGRDPVAGTAYLVSLGAFALLPWLGGRSGDPGGDGPSPEEILRRDRGR